MPSALRIVQEVRYVGAQGVHQWRCRLSLGGSAQARAEVVSVLYTLDASFPEPVRLVRDGPDFAIEFTSWAEFVLHATVTRADGSEDFFSDRLALDLPTDVSVGAPAAAATPVPAFERPRLVMSVADAVLDGGGWRAVAFAGALEAAAEAGVEEWTNVAGSSGGAIIAAFLAAGYRPREIGEILLTADYPNLIQLKSSPSRFMATLSNSGYARTPALREWLGQHLERSPLGKRDPTFGDVARSAAKELSPRSRYRLRVIASDLTGARMIVLPDDIEDYEDSRGRPLVRDEFPIVDAVIMSMSLPFALPPYILHRNGGPHHIIDGSVLSNFPVWIFDNPFPVHPTWGFTIAGTAAVGDGTMQPWQTPHNSMELVRALLYAITTAARDLESARNIARTITIPTSPTDLPPSPQEIEMLYESGLRAGRSFFSSCPEYLNSLGRGLPAEEAAFAADRVQG